MKTSSIDQGTVAGGGGEDRLHVGNRDQTLAAAHGMLTWSINQRAVYHEAA